MEKARSHTSHVSWSQASSSSSSVERTNGAYSFYEVKLNKAVVAIDSMIISKKWVYFKGKRSTIKFYHSGKITTISRAYHFLIDDIIRFSFGNFMGTTVVYKESSNKSMDILLHSVCLWLFIPFLFILLLHPEMGRYFSFLLHDRFGTQIFYRYFPTN